MDPIAAPLWRLDFTRPPSEFGEVEAECLQPWPRDDGGQANLVESMRQRLTPRDAVGGSDGERGEGRAGGHPGTWYSRDVREPHERARNGRKRYLNYWEDATRNSCTPMIKAKGSRPSLLGLEENSIPLTTTMAERGHGKRGSRRRRPAWRCPER